MRELVAAFRRVRVGAWFVLSLWIGRREQAHFAVEDAEQVVEVARPTGVSRGGQQVAVRTHVALDVRAALGQQRLQDGPRRLLVIAAFRRCRRGAEGFLQKRRPDALRSADGGQRGWRPGPRLHHLSEQRQPHRDDLAFLGQSGDGLFEEACLFGGRLAFRQRPEGPAERGQHLLGVARRKEIGRRRVVSFEQANFQIAHEPCRRHPEIVADHDDTLHPAAVALPQGLHQLGVLSVAVGVQPLLELIQNEQHLSPVADATGLAKTQCGERLKQPCLGQARTAFAQAVEQARLRVVRRRLDVHGDHLFGQSREQSCLDQRRLAATRRAVEQPHGERVVRVRLLNARLPEAQAVRQAVAVARPGQQIEEEVGVARVEGTQSLGHDAQRARIGGRRHCKERERGRSHLPRHRIRLMLREKVPHVLRQVQGGLIALRGALGQRLQTDALQLAGDRLVELPQRTRLARRDLLQQFADAVAAKRPPAREEFVADDAEAEDVAAAVNPVALAARLFGTHVHRRASQASVFAEVLLTQNQSEVGHIGLADDVEQNVGGFDVAMHQPLAMGVMQRLGDLRHQVSGLCKGEARAVHLLGQVAAVDELGHDVTQAVVGAADVVNGHDAGMIEAGEDACLFQVSLDVRRPHHAPRMGHLDGHRALKLLVDGPVNPAEAAFAEQSDDAIAAELWREQLARLFGQRRAGGRQVCGARALGLGHRSSTRVREVRPRQGRGS